MDARIDNSTVIWMSGGRQKLDKTRHGRPYSELTECNIYGDLLERIIDDMVFGKITIDEYDKKHNELNLGHQKLKDEYCYKKSKLED